MTPRPRISMWFLSGSGAEAAQIGAAPVLDLNRVIGDKNMAALKKLERALGFPNAGITLDDDPESVDVDKHAVHGRRRRQTGFESLGQLSGQSRGIVSGAQQWHAMFLARLRERRGHRRVMRNDHAWQPGDEQHRRQRISQLLGIGLLAVGLLAVAENLHPLRAETVEEPGKREPWTIEVGHRDPAAERFLPESSSRRSPSPCSLRISPTVSSAACTVLTLDFANGLNNPETFVLAAVENMDLIGVLIEVDQEHTL